MSKSYKHTLNCKDGTNHFGKKSANKKVRHYIKYISNGCYYRKIFNSYNIYDRSSSYDNILRCIDGMKQYAYRTSASEKEIMDIIEKDYIRK
jgi:hypothetical protein